MTETPTTALRFVLLGSGAVRNNPRRAGPSQILQLGGRTLLFDCGRSACMRLAQAGVQAESVDRLFLTHLHFDHVTDVPYFVFVGWNNGRQSPLRLYGPEGTEHFASRIIRPPFQQDIASRVGHGKSESGLDPEVIEVKEASLFLQEEGYSVSAAFTDHGGMPSLAYRVDTGGRRIVITGDGTPGEDFLDYSRDADLMVCECSGTAEFLAQQPWGAWHLTPEGLGELAAAAGVKRLVIKHLVMEDITGDRTAAHRMAETIRDHFGGEVMVGEDGLEVDLS
ncbi:MAG: MBL fold metallo-hydrolase [Candidatus Latescibacterota bacterium]|nr:MBL fold metallo-hydrolase [Candidatus Latescibacterota bacterium]